MEGIKELHKNAAKRKREVDDMNAAAKRACDEADEARNAACAAARALASKAREADWAAAEADNKRICGLRAAQVLAHLGSDAFAEIRAELASAGVDVAVACSGGNTCEEFDVSFVHDGAAAHVKITLHETPDHTAAGTVSFGPAARQDWPLATECRLLDVARQADWLILAAAVGLPPALRAVDVATEFVAALVAPAHTQKAFEMGFGTALETYTDAAGVARYTAAGGLRAVKFACAWTASADMAFPDVYIV